MNTRWFRPEHKPNTPEKQKFEEALHNSSVLTIRFLEILDDMENDLTRFESDLDNYTGDWTARQAFVNGERSRIRKIRELFNF